MNEIKINEKREKERNQLIEGNNEKLERNMNKLQEMIMLLTNKVDKLEKN